MRCATLYICLCIAGLVGAEAANGRDVIHPLVPRTIEIRTSSGRKRQQEPSGSRSSPPDEPPAQRHSPDRTPSRKATSPSANTENAPSQNAGPSMSPGPAESRSRSSSPPRNSPEVTSPRNTQRPSHPAAGPSSPPFPGPFPGAQQPVAPGWIRRNPAHSPQSRSGGSAPRALNQLRISPEPHSGSNPTPRAAPSAPSERGLRGQRQHVTSDDSFAKTTATVRSGRGSIMTSKLGPQGPSQLTADHGVGSFSNIAVSPYHASVLATNNLNTGTMSARASGNLLVKGRIDSLDPNGRGIMRTAVPGRSEVKTELFGVGHIASEVLNHDPNAGHARLQADFTGYGFVEAAASQDAMRPGAAANHGQQAGPSNAAARSGPTASQAALLHQVFGHPVPDAPDPNMPRNSNQGGRRSGHD